MEGPRSAKKDEFSKVLELINHVFRISRGHKPTMQQEFPLLINENNTDNMIVMLDEDTCISTVNYMHEDILIQGTRVNGASIGGVCTLEDYRKFGYSSRILDKVEEKMFNEKVDFTLISGERSLYRRRGCKVVKNFYNYSLHPKKEEMDFQLVPYENWHLLHMVDMYNSKSTRYCRSLEEFKTLLHSATIPWGNFSYRKYTILGKEGGFHFEQGIKVLGYIVVRIMSEEADKYGEVVEAAGNSHMLSKAFRNIANDLYLSRITYNVHLRDREAYLYDYDKITFGNMGGTVKIINFKNFMENLRPLFYQYEEKSIVDNMEFHEESNQCIFKYKEEILKIEDKEAITNLVFAGPMAEKLNYKDVPTIEKFIKVNFPIPFVWPYNLNYQ